MASPLSPIPASPPSPFVSPFQQLKPFKNVAVLLKKTLSLLKPVTFLDSDSARFAPATVIPATTVVCIWTCRDPDPACSISLSFSISFFSSLPTALLELAAIRTQGQAESQTLARRNPLQRRISFHLCPSPRQTCIASQCHPLCHISLGDAEGRPPCPIILTKAPEPLSRASLAQHPQWSCVP